MKQAIIALAALAAAATGAGAASAATLTAQYFEVPDTGATTGDFGPCCSSPPATLPVIAAGSALGADGLPVTTLAASGGGVVDQNASGEILWWTPSASTGVAATGTGPFTLGVTNNMFAPNSTGTDDSNFFETAILTGTLTGTGADAQITVASDDDAFVYVNGLFVGGNPGVHGAESTTIDLGDLTGTDSLEIFYADRAQVDANLLVNVTGAAVPEPATWAMMLVGFAALGAGLRMRRRQAVTAVA